MRAPSSLANPPPPPTSWLQEICIANHNQKMQQRQGGHAQGSSLQTLLQVRPHNATLTSAEVAKVFAFCTEVKVRV